MPTKTFTDAERAAKAWARAATPVSAIVGTKVFVGFNEEAGLPQLLVLRVGGAPHSGLAPLDLAVVSFSCWAASRLAASTLAYAVVGAAESMTAGTAMGASAVGQGATTVAGPRYVTSDADEKAGRHCFVVDVQFTIRAA